MPTLIEGPLLEQSAVCIPILRMLPDWFGQESGLRVYEGEIGHLLTFLANMDEQPVGFLSLKQHNPYSMEIFIMGVNPLFHRCGIGRSLVKTAEAYALEQGIEYMQVKTLAPSRPDEGYAKTRAFYAAMGFRPLEEFKRIWDENNPCLVMVKRL